MCGENCTAAAAALVDRGSSPRVRGKLDAERLGQVQDGLIPACAGKTRTAGRWGYHSGAHPRVCGENRRNVSGFVGRFGSSPRVRGKRPGHLRPCKPPGLIPACAGKTPWQNLPMMTDWAHPRVCGENLRHEWTRHRHMGSSPRVRGKHRWPHRRHQIDGLIPACAGKTRRPRPSDEACWAHPRVCGENVWRDDAARAELGSSPRVRGKPQPGSMKINKSGLIPACAGKTLSIAFARLLYAAHPRVCGENWL